MPSIVVKIEIWPKVGFSEEPTRETFLVQLPGKAIRQALWRQIARKMLTIFIDFNRKIAEDREVANGTGSRIAEKGGGLA